MPHAPAQPETNGRPWLALYAPVADELAAVEDLLAREIGSDNPLVDETVRHAAQLAGKRMRPALLLLVARACGEIRREHITLAAVVEMIHTATLVHDDVLDEATLRRRRDTVNARFGNEISVLVGDFLFTHAFYLASTTGSTFGCQTIGRSTNIVCAGEMRQVKTRGRFDLSEAEYLEIIDAKTAELCACCGRLGAHYASVDESQTGAMDRYGRMLGIAFQIADDLLDVTGQETLAGKSLGTDLEKQKPTLPLIRLLDQLPLDERRRLVAVLSTGGRAARQALADCLADSDALDYARRRAGEFACAARAELSCLAPSAARSILEVLTELAVARCQ